MKILIVDDSKAMRHIITRALKEIGLKGSTFFEASDGNEAMNTIKGENPHLVICDFNMPGMSGMELLRTLRSNGVANRFGFITSEASSELRQEAADTGALFVITKPFTAGDVSLALTPILAELGVQSDAVEDEAPAASTTANLSFPKPAQVAALLKNLLRRAVVAFPAPATPLLNRDGQIFAEYERVDDASVVACAVSDIPWAVRTGSAFTLIPQGAAAEAIAAREIADAIAENLREVLSVMSRLFECPRHRRVQLSSVHLPGEVLNPELAKRLAKPSARVDVCIEIAGYGKGNLTLVSLS